MLIQTMFKELSTDVLSNVLRWIGFILSFTTLFSFDTLTVICENR